MSASALPLISFATSASDGLYGVGVSERRIQNGIGELAALFLIELADLQKDRRQNVLIKPRLSRRRQRDILPLQPARRVDERSVFLREARAGQSVDGGVDLLLFIGRDARSAPELAGFVRIDLADHQPVGFLQGLDVLLLSRARS